MSAPNSQEHLNEELKQRISALSKMLVKSFGYAQADPDSFLLNARKTTETICKFIYNKDIGDEGGKKMMLNDYGRALVSKKIIPERIGLLIGTIQTYGNYGAHAQEDMSEASAEWIAPCQTALANLTNWFFLEYLQGDIPAELSSPLKAVPDTPVAVETKKRSQILTLVVGLFVVIGSIAAFLISRTNNGSVDVGNQNIQRETVVSGNNTTDVQLVSANHETSITKSADAKRLVVLYFENNADDPKIAGLSKGLADMMITDLSKYHMIQVVEREKIESILKEQDMSHTNRFDKSTAIKLGKLLGAEAILTGSYFEMIGNLRIDARIIDVETSAILKSEGVNGSTDNFFDLEKQLVGKIISGLEIPLKKEEETILQKPLNGQFTMNAGLSYSKALDLLDQGKTQEAKDALKNVLVETPDFEPALNALQSIEL